MERRYAMKYDGHVHTPYCPHGSSDSFVQYIERALQLGLKEISFTEHAPLPEGFVDTTPTTDSAMHIDDLQPYFEDIQIVKERYKSQIKINVGLEIDFIEGFEEEIKIFLTKYGPFLDDSLLSVHFLKTGNDWICLDYSHELFGELTAKLGSVDEVYKCYYNTVEKAINSDLGEYKPKRIGHLTLVQKFQKKYPPSLHLDERVFALLDIIKQKGLALDYNGAGVMKDFCLEPYPSHRFVTYAQKIGIPLVYGSDAHQAKDLGQGFHQLLPVALSAPSSLK